MQGQMSFDDHGTIVDNPKGNREPHWDKEIPWLELPDDDEIHLYRLVAAPYYYAQHWIQSFKKDKTPGKSFPVICQNYDPKTNTFAENGCEACLFMDEVNKMLKEFESPKDPKDKVEWKDLPQKITKMSRRTTMAQNAIIRELQAQGAPSNSASWTFIRPIRFPQGFSKTLKEHQTKFNKRDGQEWALNHKTEGRDLQLSYNSQSDDKNKIYMLMLGEITPLTDAEIAQAPHLTDFASFMKYPKQPEIADALRRFGYYDWINEYRASKPSASVPRSAPASAPAQQTIRQPAQAATAFDVPAGQPEPPFEPEPAAAAPAASPAPKAAPQAPIAAAPAPAAAPAAPVIPQTNTVAMQQQQTPVAPPQAPAAPVAQAAPAAAPTGAQAGVEGRLQSFSTQTGVPLVVAGKTYAKALRLYRPDLAVPTCWSTYSATSRANREQCKQCPLRLDCMMATG